MRNQQAFWDKIAEKYVPRPIDEPEAYERKIELTRPYLTANMNVLEIGCGSGNTGRRHAPHVASYTAMDLSPEMIRLGRAEGPIPDNMTMQVADCDVFEMMPCSYDAVLAMSLLHLLPNPQATVTRIAEALVPGGLFVTSTAVIGHMWPLKIVTPLLQRFGKVPHLNFFHDTDVRALMTNAGLTVEVDERLNKSPTHFLIARKPA